MLFKMWLQGNFTPKNGIEMSNNHFLHVFLQNIADLLVESPLSIAERGLEFFQRCYT